MKQWEDPIWSVCTEMHYEFFEDAVVNQGHDVAEHQFGGYLEVLYEE